MSTDHNSEMKRRKFLQNGAKGAAVVGLGAAAGFAVSRLPGRSRSPESQDREKLGDEFTYDISKYQKTDPSLIGYRQAGRIETGFKLPRAIAIGPEGKLFVAGDRSVRTFDKKGRRLTEFKPSGLPLCLSITSDGVYVGLKSHVEIYDAEGVLKSAWDRLGSEAVLKSIAVVEGAVFAADAGRRIVVRFDSDGKVVRHIGKKDPSKDIPGFVVPSPYFCLRIAPDGRLRVANPGRHQIETYTFDGELEHAWGKPSMAIDGFCGCCNPVSFAMQPDGQYITAEKGLTRVKTCDADGVFQKVVAGPEHFPDATKTCAADALTDCTRAGLDVAVAEDGRVFVLDIFGRDIRIMEKKG